MDRLLKTTPFSQFFKASSVEQREDVYKEVIDRSIQRQKAVIKKAEKKFS